MTAPARETDIYRHLRCDHQYTGVVRWPENYPGKNRRSQAWYSCDRPECVREAAIAVRAATGHEGIYYPFSEGS